ncbi:acyl-CoA dehydrogenase family protein [Novosphingobium cyanobacteriorum]|uniref:Acyl-CoA dehydrogenase family protein n=1 Tax=Novosphingobium cyanobacteriorum TaxID=3024215 RepID=A0ABT6CNA9_9SPHN|nr:acyl-CoA dehydrogenase family protein [Novosphingobium cyanobacteriorum]MDF8335392.1 acyl-CoA dehydrogenase family protein [Novosphingobium cyanobacteriorum]
MFHDKTLRANPEEHALKAEAERLAPLFEAKGPENEAAGQLSPETVTELRGNGFFGMMVPKELGGADCTPLQTLSVVESLCHSDSATGWVTMAANVATASAAAFLPDEGVRTVFAKPGAMVAGAGAPRGKAEIDGNGYRLSGTWTYGSGCLHCDWIHAGAMIYENGAPRMIPGTNTPESRIFVVPVEQVEFLGNWDVLGLRATGSVDYAIRDVYVPHEMTHSASEVVGKRGGNGYRIGVVGFSALGHTGFALGHGRRILDELLALVTSPTGRPSPLASLGGSDAFKQDYAVAEGKLRAARAFVYDVWSDIQDTVDKSEPVSVRQITLARLALNHATNAMMEISVFAHRAGGGVALHAGPLQRTLRDSFAATQHVMVSDNALRDCGLDFLGLAEGKRWTPRGLVDAN